MNFMAMMSQPGPEPCGKSCGDAGGRAAALKAFEEGWLPGSNRTQRIQKISTPSKLRAAACAVETGDGEIAEIAAPAALTDRVV